MRFAPVYSANDLPRIGVKQQLVRVEAMAIDWIMRAMDPIAIEHAGPYLRQVGMPDLIGIFLELDAGDFRLAAIVVETELDPVCMS